LQYMHNLHPQTQSMVICYVNFVKQLILLAFVPLVG